jgi:hypothetical protein
MFQTNPSPVRGDRTSTAKRRKRWGEATDEPKPVYRKEAENTKIEPLIGADRAVG